MDAELLEYERKIKRAEAMEKVYEEEEKKVIESQVEDEAARKRTKDESPRKRRKHRICKIKEKIEKRKERIGKRDRSKGQEKGRNSHGFDETLLQVLQVNSAPEVKIDEFAGDVLEYQYFVETFREVVERAIPDERGRLTRLIQSTSGEPKELIRHCIHDDKSTCYTNAMKLLEQHYGDPHRIAIAYMKELGEWPALIANDSSSFRSFNRFLIKCKIYKKKDNFLKELDSAETLRTLVLKLPLNLQDKWSRKADDIKRKKARIPDFVDFCDLIDIESRIANDPLFSREALHGTSKPASNKPPAIPSLATMFETQLIDQTCHMCGSTNHDLDDCEEYKKLSRSARVKFLYEKRLCYSCYGNKTKDHISATCPQKRTCNVCQADHPTGLHKFEVIPSRSTVTSQLDKDEEVVSMCVLPVRLGHEDCPGKEVVVYAVLDDCSRGTFVLESAMEGLNIPGIRCTEQDARIDTMIGSATQKTIRVEGLVVKCSAKHERNYPTSSAIGLPATHTRKMIPIDQEEMPTPERVKRWKYLESIVKHLPEYDPSIPFALLIGANCPRALEPHQVINSQETGPYAIRSQLGWCVIGTLGISQQSIYKTSQHKVNSRLTTLDVSTNQVSKHHFVVQRNIEDTSIKQMLSKMYNSEFSEAYNEKTSLSQEDRKFMNIMESGCKVIRGHYQLPLPFRDNEVRMPYNKAMAVQRSIPLKR